MIADRFTLQQSWWLLSELCRRHPEMVMDRFVHDEGGPVLMARRGGDLEHRVAVMCDLHTGVQIHMLPGPGTVPWEEVFASAHPHHLLKHIEQHSLLGVPRSAPATTPRTLTYRLAARLLALRLDDRHDWSIEPVDLHEVARDREDAEELLAGFPTAVLDVEEKMRHLQDHPAGLEQALASVPCLWRIVRDVETVALLDTDGFVHARPAALVRTMDLYRERGRDLDRVLMWMLDAL